MDVNKLGLKVKVLNAQDDSGKFISGSAHFFSGGITLGVTCPVVACNRKGDGCWTRIDQLQEHNHHVPQFNSKTSRDSWVKRIQTDVEKVAKEFEYSEKETKSSECAGCGGVAEMAASLGPSCPDCYDNLSG